MVSNSKALQRQIAFLAHDSYQGEVGSAATDIADKDDITVFHLFPPRLLIMGKPRIESRLRLFQKGEMQIKGIGGLNRQIPCNGVK